MKRVLSKIAKSITLVGIGFLIGAFEENMRYSIIHHEAKKGDKEAQAIVDQFDQVGGAIEDMFKKDES